MHKETLKELMLFSKTLHLLYVEDNETTRMQTEKLLENFFDHITVATDGKEGLEKFKQHNFDLIISDINMPNMNGLEMLSAIRTVDEDIPFIILSAHNEADMFSTSITLGTDGYLLKPIESKSYLSLMTRTIKKIKQKHENALYKKELELSNKLLEQKIIERTGQLHSKLMQDELTNIKSRYAFLSELALCAEPKVPIIFLLNIDSFGLYNELYGVEVGNDVLIAFSKLLQNFANANKYGLYRISGDEFVLYESVSTIDETKIRETLTAIKTLLKDKPLWIERIQDSIDVSVTIGVSTCHDNPLGKSDMAMKHAKKTSRSFMIYSKDIDTKKDLEKTLYWKKEIDLALLEDRVIPFFQPIVNREEEIIKYEALMRIKQLQEDGEEKIISPFFFLDISMKTKQYNQLSYRLIDKAIMGMMDKNISLSLNVNQNDMHDNTLINMLKSNILKFNNYNLQKQQHGNSIILEVLEDDDIKDYTEFTDALMQFRHLGAQIAIDDFGSGFSNFSHIIGISPHYVKIDGSLIKELAQDTKSYEIVKAIVQFAKSLHIKTIAEFVATKEIFDVAYSLGIDEFQGYYFSEPLPIEKIEERASALV